MSMDMSDENALSFYYNQARKFEDAFDEAEATIAQMKDEAQKREAELARLRVEADRNAETAHLALDARDRLHEALRIVQQTFEDEYGPASDQGMGPPWSDPIFNALKATTQGGGDVRISERTGDDTHT